MAPTPQPFNSTVKAMADKRKFAIENVNPERIEIVKHIRTKAGVLEPGKKHEKHLLQRVTETELRTLLDKQVVRVKPKKEEEEDPLAEALKASEPEDGETDDGETDEKKEDELKPIDAAPPQGKTKRRKS